MGKVGTLPTSGGHGVDLHHSFPFPLLTMLGSFLTRPFSFLTAGDGRQGCVGQVSTHEQACI